MGDGRGTRVGRASLCSWLFLCPQSAASVNSVPPPATSGALTDPCPLPHLFLVTLPPSPWFALLRSSPHCPHNLPSHCTSCPDHTLVLLPLHNSIITFFVNIYRGLFLGQLQCHLLQEAFPASSSTLDSPHTWSLSYGMPLKETKVVPP